MLHYHSIIICLFVPKTSGGEGSRMSLGTRLAHDVYLLPSIGGVGVHAALQMVLTSIWAGASALPAFGPSRLKPGAVRWSSSNPQIATVDQTGRVIGMRAGVVTITANLGGSQSRQSRITVGEPVVRVLVTGGPIPHHCTVLATAQPVDISNQPLKDRPVRWASSAPQTASVLPPTLSTATILAQLDKLFLAQGAFLQGKQVGQATIVATSERAVANVPFDVVPSDPTSLEMRPDRLVLDVQETASVMAVVRNQQGCLDTDSIVSWTIDDPTIAAISATVTLPQQVAVGGVKAGTTNLTATTQNGLTVSIPVTIPAVSSIVLNPSQISEIDIGATRVVTATTLSPTGTILKNRRVTWNSSTGAVPVQPVQGSSTTVTGRLVGSAIVTAASEGVSAALTATVPAVASVSISPPSLSLPIGSV